MKPGLELRRDDILDSATRIISEGGLDALTTAALAAAARCSKKTIYALFPDKDQLLAAVIGRQAATIAQALDRSLSSAMAAPEAARQTAVRIGAALYATLLSPPSLAINRASMADQTARLGTLLRENGRERFVPRIGALLALAAGPCAEGLTEEELFLLYYGLLMGDRQIAALLGAKQVIPDENARLAKANRALDDLVIVLVGRASVRSPQASS